MRLDAFFPARHLGNGKRWRVDVWPGFGVAHGLRLRQLTLISKLLQEAAQY